MCKSSKICKREYFNDLNFKSISDTEKFWMTIILSKKCPNTEFFLVRTFPYLTWIQKFTEKYEPEKTPYLNTFHAVSNPTFPRTLKSWNNQRQKKVPHTFNMFMKEVPVLYKRVHERPCTGFYNIATHVMKVLISILRIWLTFWNWKIHLLLWCWNNSKANLSKRFRTYLIAKKDKIIKIVKELPKRKPVLLKRFQLKPGSTWFTYTVTL